LGLTYEAILKLWVEDSLQLNIWSSKLTETFLICYCEPHIFVK